MPAAQRCNPFQPDSEPRKSRPMARSSMCGSAAKGRPPSCCTVMARPATCGRPLAAELARDHTVIVPDLRGMGLSSRPASGYDKKNQGQDVAGVLDALKIERADVVAHDIGNMVGYAFTAQYPKPDLSLHPHGRAAAGRRALGRDPQEPAPMAFPLWRPRHGAAGRGPRAHLPRPLLERVFGRSARRSAKPAREHYAKLYAQPGAMHAGFAQFAAFDQDAIDNRAFVAEGKLAMPVLAIGGDQSFGATMAMVMRAAATDVQERVIPKSGHWLMEEQPAATVAAVRAFLDKRC